MAAETQTLGGSGESQWSLTTAQEAERLIQQASGVKKDQHAFLLEKELPWPEVLEEIREALVPNCLLGMQLKACSEIQEICLEESGRGRECKRGRGGKRGKGRQGGRKGRGGERRQ